MNDLRAKLGKEALVLAVCMAAAHATVAANAPAQRAEVSVFVSVEPFADIQAVNISVHLVLTDNKRTEAHSDPIPVVANAPFDAALTVADGRLLGGPMQGGPFQGRFPYAVGDEHGERLVYVPSLHNGDGATAEWSGTEERAFLPKAVLAGADNTLQVGVWSRMMLTPPPGGLAPPDTYRGTLLLTLTPSGT